MLARVGEVVAEIKANPPPLPAEEIAEAIQFLEWLCGDNFTLLGVRDYRFAASAEEPEPVQGSGLGILRNPELRELTRSAGQVVMAREMRAYLQRAESADGHQGEHPFARASPRVHGLCRGQAVRRQRQGWSASCASSGCSPRPPIPAPPAPSRMCAARSMRWWRARASSRRAIPARRWSICWRPIRATSCSGSTRTRSISSRSRSCSSASGRVCACWRGAIASTASCRCWSMCRAIAPTTTWCAAIGAFLADMYQGRVADFNLFFPEGALVRIHFIVARFAADDAEPDRAVAGIRRRRHRAHLG